MKVLVTYMSKTGNTRKIAEAIYDEIDAEKEIMHVDKVDSMQDYDLTFMGFPIQQMGPDKKAAKLMQKHCIDDRDVVLFITHAAPEGAPDLQPMLDKFKVASAGANVIDMFDCQGELSKTVKRIMSVLPNANLRRWAKEDNSKGQPDASRIQAARDFTRGVMSSYAAQAK